MADRRVRTREAFELLKAGRHDEAKALLEQMVHNDDADAAVLETLGDVREKLGDAAGALDAYLGAVTHLRARGELSRALGILELMSLVDEGAVLVPSETAEVRRALGDPAGCWREVAKACELAFAQGDPASALSLCAAHIDVLPDAGVAVELVRRLEPVDRAAAMALCTALAEDLLERRRFDDALALYGHVLDVDPAAPQALQGRARALYASGHHDPLDTDPSDLER